MGEKGIFGRNEVIGIFFKLVVVLELRSLIKILGMLSWVIGDFWENIHVVFEVGMLFGNFMDIL